MAKAFAENSSFSFDNGQAYLNMRVTFMDETRVETNYTSAVFPYDADDDVIREAIRFAVQTIATEMGFEINEGDTLYSGLRRL
jgi:hypothetical protein